MSKSGIDPNDLCFDSECFSEYEINEKFDHGIMPAPIAEGGDDSPFKSVQFDDVVRIFDGGSIPLSGGDGFWDTRQYENERMGMQDFDNSASISINDFGSISDESLGDFTPSGQQSSGKNSNKADNAPSVRHQNTKRNFDIFPKKRNNSNSTNENDIGSNVGEVQNVENKMHYETERQHFISDEDVRGQISSASNITRTGQQPMTTNTHPSSNYTTESTRATKQ
jgi:hypothetical protein